MSTPMTYRQHLAAILTLGLPLIGGNLAQIAVGLTDTLMMGWYSVTDLAAMVLASTLFFVLFIFGSGFAMAVMPMVARDAESGDVTGRRRVTRMGLWLSTLFALLALPVFWFSGPVLRALGQEAELAAAAQSYLRIAGWGIAPALLFMVLKSTLAALEHTRVVLVIALVAAGANALGNYALIFGNFGLPEMGIRGAALSSLLVHVISFCGAVVYIQRVFPEANLFQRLWRVDLEILVVVFRLGLPIGVTMLAEVGLFSASSVMMGWIGTAELAAHGIALQLASISFMVQLGLASVATIRAGNAQGAQDLLRLRRGAAVVSTLALVVALVTVAILLIVPEPLLAVFLDPEAPLRDEILRIGVILLAWAALFQLFDAGQVLGLGLLRGVQDTTVPMIIAAISYWLIGISSGYYLAFFAGWGGSGIWAGLTLGLACASVALFWRFLTRAARGQGPGWLPDQS